MVGGRGSRHGRAKKPSRRGPERANAGLPCHSQYITCPGPCGKRVSILHYSRLNWSSPWLSSTSNGTNANAEEFSRSRSEWIDAISAWRRETIHERTLLRYAMVADSRPFTETALGRCLTDPIRGHARDTRFLRALLDEALGFWSTRQQRTHPAAIHNCSTAHEGDLADRRRVSRDESRR